MLRSLYYGNTLPVDLAGAVVIIVQDRYPKLAAAMHDGFVIVDPDHACLVLGGERSQGGDESDEDTAEFHGEKKNGC